MAFRRTAADPDPGGLRSRRLAQARIGLLRREHGDSHQGSALVLRWTKGRLETESLPGMPEPRANLCGALLGNTAFPCGGAATPGAPNALSTLFSMNLSPKHPGWCELEPLPGPGRTLATAGACDGSFYVFGGAALHPGPDGKPVREWLRDAWRYTPGKGWKRIVIPSGEVKPGIRSPEVWSAIARLTDD